MLESCTRMLHDFNIFMQLKSFLKHDLCIFHKALFLFTAAKNNFNQFKQKLSCKRQIYWYIYTCIRLHAERESISDHKILLGNKNELIPLDVGTNKYVNFQAKSIISFAMIVQIYWVSLVCQGRRVQAETPILWMALLNLKNTVDQQKLIFVVLLRLASRHFQGKRD